MKISDYICSSLVKTKNGEIRTTIVGKSGNYLLTLNGERINMLEINDIERIWTLVCTNLTNKTDYGKIVITSRY